MFKRKLYESLLTWKKESSGKTAALIEGARRNIQIKLEYYAGKWILRIVSDGDCLFQDQPGSRAFLRPGG